MVSDKKRFDFAFEIYHLRHQFTVFLSRERKLMAEPLERSEFNGD